MKKVIVTGGAGFIGSHTVVELINAGYEPIILDNFSNSDERIIKQLEILLDRELEVHNIDCTKEQQLARFFLLEGDIHGIIHFAAHKAVGESVEHPLKYYRNNLDSLMNLVKLMEESNVNNLVFSSSCTVYGEPDTTVVTESSPRKEATSPYGNTKRIGEDIIRDLANAGKLSSAILRYFNPIGAHPSGLIGELPQGVPNNLVPYLTQVASGQRESLTIFGDDYDTPDGTCIRDYIHVVDLAKAHVNALQWLESNNSVCDTFNIGTGHGNSVLELVNSFQEVNGIPLKYTIGEKRSGDVSAIYADGKKAEEILKWKAEFTMADALKDAWTWQNYLKNNW